MKTTLVHHLPEADVQARWLQKMREGKEAMRQRCQQASEAIIAEAEVTHVRFHDGGLVGTADARWKAIYAPTPTTRRRLYIVAHECGHVALSHDRKKPRHRREYEAERYAHEALRQQGIAVPKRSTISAKKYVAWKIHQAIRRGAKHIDPESLRWCEPYLSREVRQWLDANRGRRPRRVVIAFQ